MVQLPPDYPERAYAAVLGKLIGVYLGRPFEGWTYQRIMKELGPIESYVHERLNCPLVVTDDDVAGTFTFVRALEDHGVSADLTAREIGETWLNYIVDRRSILWWGGNGVSTEHTAWLNLKSGVAAPKSGATATNGATIAEQIGAQIFIDGWAIVAPGNPKLAARLAEQAAKVSHDGAAVDAAKLWAAMEAEAFVSRDIERLLAVGLAEIPEESPIAALIADIRHWRQRHPDWRETREAIEANYGYDKYPGNCHVIPNHALMIMALLYAPDDFSLAQTIVNTSGWDTDCNAGNVGCLMGAMLGLEGIDAKDDWRGPLADRVLISSADGAGSIEDAVRIAARLVNLGRRLASLEPLTAPKDGARFHFSRAGSLQGFNAEDGSPARLVTRNVSFGGGRALECRFYGLTDAKGPFLTPTFTPPDVTRMRTYELMASPLLHPGQTVRARVIADGGNRGSIALSLRALVYGRDDALAPLDSEETALEPGDETTLAWRLPETGGQPIQAIGLALRSRRGAQDGAVVLDYLRWDGAPTMRLRRPADGGGFWRRAWVNAVSTFSEQSPQSIRISQDSGEGMLIYGGRGWTDYRVEATVTVHLAAYAGVAIRVHGLRRYYAALLVRPGLVRIVRVYDGEIATLAEAKLDWAFEAALAFRIDADGDRITAHVGGVTLAARDTGPHALTDGGIAFVLSGGALSCDEVVVAPPPAGADETRSRAWQG
jgi:ADP-ribosylglycohydrolase